CRCRACAWQPANWDEYDQPPLATLPADFASYLRLDRPRQRSRPCRVADARGPAVPGRRPCLGSTPADRPGPANGGLRHKVAIRRAAEHRPLSVVRAPPLVECASYGLDGNIERRRARLARPARDCASVMK